MFLSSGTRYTGHTQKNGAVSIVNSFETAPFFCVCPVMYTLYKKDVCHFELECAYVEHTADGESRRRRCTFEDTLKQLTVNHLVKKFTVFTRHEDLSPRSRNVT